MTDAHFMRLAWHGWHRRADDLQPFDAIQFAQALFEE